MGIDPLPAIERSETLYSQLLGGGNVPGIGAAQPLLKIIDRGRCHAVGNPRYRWQGQAAGAELLAENEYVLGLPAEHLTTLDRSQGVSER